MNQIVIFDQRTAWRNAAEMWKRQYLYTVKGWHDDNKRLIYERLLIAKSRQDVDDAIGNTAWTTQRCDHCGETKPLLVRMGQEPDYESATAWICSDCLKAARLAMLKASKANN